VSVLWSYWAFAAAALTFPLQHWVTRAATVDGEATVRRALPRVLAATVGLALLSGLVAWLLRDPLFGRGDAWFPALVALTTLGSALVGLLRGVLGSRRRFAAVGASLVAENALRCVGVGALALLGADDPVGYGWCLVAGHLVVLLYPGALVPEPRGRERRTRALAFLAGAGSAQLVHQVVLTGGPVALALLGGSPAEVTGLFAALALFRAPYMLALGVVARLTGSVARLRERGSDDVLRRGTVRLALVTGVAVAAGAGLGAAAGPALLGLVFGSGVTLAASLCAVVAAASVVAVANLVLTVTGLALGRSAAVSRSWLPAAAVGVAVLLVPNGLAPVERCVAAFALAEAVAFGLQARVSARA
jgi:O-antigen/teichoic acid export membrane protein